MNEPLSLSQLTRRIAEALSRPTLTNVWVVAELSDLRVSHGHCYMELIDKDEKTGAVNARLRAVIWASTFLKLNSEFFACTGQRLASGLKVMVAGSVNFHSAYGLSFVINGINPQFTMGESERRRREIIQRLTAEGVIDLNKNIEWPELVQRIAIISAPGAAGYGDFINQLYSNPSRLRFSTELFTALMQGDRTSGSIIAALDEIAARCDDFDCVVIIRGGGATSDLMAFDDYDLAANVAQFPLPIIVGIGHERDVTVLDFVANMRVKTPTAAAEWLISVGENALERLRRIASDILLTSSEIISSAKTHLAYLESNFSIVPIAALQRAEALVRQSSISLSGISARRIAPELARLQARCDALDIALKSRLGVAAKHIDNCELLVAALSPLATLKRGYSLTMVDGRTVRSAAELSAGQEITTAFADGQVMSIIQ